MIINFVVGGFFAAAVAGFALQFVAGQLMFRANRREDHEGARRWCEMHNTAEALGTAGIIGLLLYAVVIVIFTTFWELMPK